MVAFLQQDSRAATGSKNAYLISLYRVVKPTLEMAVYVCLDFKCTDPRDHINALLGLVEDIDSQEPNLRPDYRASAADVFREFAVWIVKQNSLGFFDWPSESNVIHGILGAKPRRSEALSGTYVLTDGYAASGASRVYASTKGDRNLQIAGIVVDKILSLATLQYKADWMEELTEAGTQTRSEASLNVWDNIRQQLREWIEECKRIAFGDCAPEDIRSNLRWTELWRTILWDSHETGKRATPELGDKLLEFFDLLELTTTNYVETNSDQLIGLHVRAKLWHIHRCLENSAKGKLLCSTVNGRLGSVRVTTQPGDRICIFLGSRVPHVIRPYGNEEYTLVGPCYLHGVMDGEAMAMNDFREEIIVLA